MFTRRTQRGQALVLIALAIIGLIAITALAIDGGNAFAARRRAQSAADNAALSAALSLVTDQSLTEAQLRTAILPITEANGLEDSTVTIQHPPGPGCDGTTPNPVKPYNPLDRYTIDNIYYYNQVVIRSSVNAYFGPVIGIRTLDYCVQAIARSKPVLLIPPFNGNAVVGLDPFAMSFEAQSNAQWWHIWGGGIFANNNATDDHSNVSFPDHSCVTAVGTVTNFDPSICVYQNQADYKYVLPDDVRPLMPPIPPCDGTAFVDSDNRYHEQTGFEGHGSKVKSFVWDVGDYAPGLYCVIDAGGEIHSPITGTGVTFYIMDQDFTLKFNGNGYIASQAPTEGIYRGVLIFSDFTPTPLTQQFEIRGNGSTPIIGTIFLPSAYIDYRGNGVGDAMQSQVIGYDVSTNGSANVDVIYNADTQWRFPQPPVIELTK
jgi:hypothetical protein